MDKNWTENGQEMAKNGPKNVSLGRLNPLGNEELTQKWGFGGFWEFLGGHRNFWVKKEEFG